MKKTAVRHLIKSYDLRRGVMANMTRRRERERRAETVRDTQPNSERGAVSITPVGSLRVTYASWIHRAEATRKRYSRKQLLVSRCPSPPCRMTKPGTRGARSASPSRQLEPVIRQPCQQITSPRRFFMLHGGERRSSLSDFILNFITCSRDKNASLTDL